MSWLFLLAECVGGCPGPLDNGGGLSSHPSPSPVDGVQTIGREICDTKTECKTSRERQRWSLHLETKKLLKLMLALVGPD